MYQYCPSKVEHRRLVELPPARLHTPHAPPRKQSHHTEAGDRIEAVHSFANAEIGEKLIKYCLIVNGSTDLAQRIQGIAKVHQGQFRGRELT